MAIRMTRAEFYAKYGDVTVTFSCYYKYTFTYSATLPNGNRLVVGCGGNSDDIYEHEVEAHCGETVNRLQPYTGAVYEDEEVEGFYDTDYVEVPAVQAVPPSISFDDFVDSLYEAGWRSPCDAQHTEIEKLWRKLWPQT